MLFLGCWWFLGVYVFSFVVVGGFLGVWVVVFGGGGGGLFCYFWLLCVFGVGGNIKHICKFEVIALI